MSKHKEGLNKQTTPSQTNDVEEFQINKGVGQDFIDLFFKKKTPLTQAQDRNTKLIQAPEPKLGEKITSKLPSFLQTGVKTIKEGFFGNPEDKREIDRLEDRGVDIPMINIIKSEGLLPFLGRTELKKVEISRDSQLKRGVAPERAEKIAIAEVMARKGFITGPANQRFQELELTKAEKKGVRRARLGQLVGSGLDAASFIPIGAISNTGKTTLTKIISKTNKADEIFGALKRYGTTDDLARTYSKTFAGLTNETEIAKGVSELDDAMRITSQQGATKAEPLIEEAKLIQASDDIPVDSYRIVEDSNLQRINEIDSEVNKIRGKRLSGKINAKKANKQVEKLNKEKLKVAKDNGVALIRDEKGKVTGTSIRKSGFYAPKEIELLPFKDIKGFAGGQSFNLRDAYISGDNITRSQMAKTGDIGPLEKIAYNADQAEVKMMDWGNRKAQDVRDMAKRFGLNLSDETTDIQTTLALHGLTNEAIKAKGAKKAIIDVLRRADISEEALQQVLKPGFLRNIVNKESKILKSVENGLSQDVLDMVNGPLRKHFDDMLEEVNKTRLAMGRKEIAKRENYGPLIQKTDFWSKMRATKKTTITEDFDYVIPNAKKNPHAQLRKGGSKDLDFRFSELGTRYHEAISRDIFDAPIIEQLKAVNKVLKSRGKNGLSKLTERHIREARVGMPEALDSYFGIKPGTAKRSVLQKVNLARTISALSANLVWIGFVQPASLVMTLARSGPINMAKGIFEFATSPGARSRINKLPTIATKRGGKSIGSTGAGDLDILGSKIVKTKIESFNDFLGKIADSNEYWLTGSATLAGESRATKIGLTGDAKKIYADWMGGATQSRYNKTARPMISNSMLIRTSFPFQTYAFELYRYTKTLAGKTGGRPLEVSERINQTLLLLSGMYMYNKYLEAATGRRLTTPGTFVPLAGSLLDAGLNRASESLGTGEITDKLGITDTEEIRQGGSGRAAGGAIAQDVFTFYRAMNTYTKHGNIQPLRKEAVKWGMGFSGVSGASTVNRLVDGLIANAQGFQTNRTGNRLFRIEGVDKYLSPILGPYSTRAGLEYFKEGGSIVVQDARKEKKRLVNLPRQDARKEFDRILGENPALAEQINLLIENERNPILGKIREFTGQERVQAIVEEMDKVIEGDKIEEFDKLLDAKFGYKSEGKKTEVANKVNKIFKQRETATKGEIPAFEDGEVISDKTLIEIVGLFAKGVAESPTEFDYNRAFKIIFSGEGRRLRRIDNGALIVVRDPEFAKGTKEEREADDGTFLDHMIPLQLGGLDRDKNVIVVERSEWEAYTPVENLLGDHLREGNIGRKEAQELIRQFKEGEISPKEIVEKYPIIEGGALGSFSKPFLDRMENNRVYGQSDAEAFSLEIFRTLGKKEF